MSTDHPHVYLIRHGRPAEGHPTQAGDPPLDDLGHAQARAVARWLASRGIRRVISSPLLRAVQTAQPFADAAGLEIERVDGWAEADRGSARYRSMETIRAGGREQWRAFLADPVAMLGGDPVAFRAAVLGALAHTVSRAADGPVAVFAHGMPINLVLSHVLGLPRITHFAPAHASVTRLRGPAAERLMVVSVNETQHLD